MSHVLHTEYTISGFMYGKVVVVLAEIQEAMAADGENLNVFDDVNPMSEIFVHLMGHPDANEKWLIAGISSSDRDELHFQMASLDETHLKKILDHGAYEGEFLEGTEEGWNNLFIGTNAAFPMVMSGSQQVDENGMVTGFIAFNGEVVDEYSLSVEEAQEVSKGPTDLMNQKIAEAHANRVEEETGKNPLLDWSKGNISF